MIIFVLMFASAPLLHAQIQSIAETENRLIWVSSSIGLFQIADGKPRLVERGAFHSLAADGDLVWAASNRGLLRCRQQGCQQDSRMPNAEIQFVMKYDQHLWAATETDVFEIVDRKAIPLAVPSTTIESIAVDGAGGLWIASREFIGRFQDGAFQRVVKDSAQALATDPDGGMWVGSGFEIFRWSNGKTKSIQLTPPPSNVRTMPPIKTLLISADKKVWIGTGTGLLEWNGKSLQKILTDVEITSLFEDSSSNLWIGTTQGLKMRKDGKLIDIPLPTERGN